MYIYIYIYIYITAVEIESSYINSFDVYTKI